jgi:drug/metabolite transporter (DMT)-like permease
MARPGRPALVAAFASIYLFWGGTFLAIRWAVADLPPLLTIALRCGAGGALLLLWLRLRGEWVRSSVRGWATAAVAGTLLFLGCHSVMATVEQRVSSGETALLMTTIPLWLVLLDSVRRKTAPPPLVVAGLLFGAAGVAVLTGGAALSGGSAGDRIALVLCALSWAVGSLVARDGERPTSAVQATAMQLLSGGLVVAVVSALSSARAVGGRAAHAPGRRLARLPGGLRDRAGHGLVHLAPAPRRRLAPRSARTRSSTRSSLCSSAGPWGTTSSAPALSRPPPWWWRGWCSSSAPPRDRAWLAARAAGTGMTSRSSITC